VTTLPTLVLVDVYGDVAARYAGDEPERLSDFLAAVRRLADDAARQNPTTQPADKASRPKTAYWTMAVRLAEARDSAGSAAALRKLLDEAPRHVAGRAFLAELLLSAGDVDEAEGLVTEGLQLAPSDACLLTLAGRCALARDEVWLAVRRCRRAVANDPALAAGHAYLGVALIRAGQIAEGREVIRRAVAIEPANARFWLLLGDAARSAGDRPAAVDGYERGFRLLAAEPCGLVDVSEPMR
jgi:predicted Zn-dependent protease